LRRPVRDALLTINPAPLAAAAAVGAVIFLTTAVLVLTGAADAADARALVRVAQLRRDAITPMVLQVTALGNGLTVSLVAAIGALLLLALGRGRSAFFLLLATIGGMLLHSSLKPLLGRARPEESGWLTTATTLGFPSGHAVNAAATYGALAILALALPLAAPIRRGAAAAFCVVIVAVAASRTYLGVHHPLDVIGGCALGIAWVFAAAAVMRLTEKR
jgi:undecaprenyl-diphosphatase